MRMLIATCIFIVTINVIRKTDAVCYDSADCKPSGCCTIARHNYPTPGCNEFRKEGDLCKQNHKPFNTTASKPDGSFWYNATNVYDLLCPCAQGLTCVEGSCKKEH